MDYEIERAIQKAKRIEETRQATTQLIDSMNTMGCGEDFAEGFFQGLSQQHRTLQQDFMRNFAEAMVKYSKINTDLRNADSVAFAKKITEIDQWFQPV